MDNRLSFNRKLKLFPLKAMAFLVTYIAPFLILFLVFKDQLVWDNTTQPKFIGTAIGILAAIIWALIYVRVIKKRINRRLQSEDTVEALGAVPARSIIVKDILKAFEIIWPLGIAALFLLSIDFITTFNFKELYILIGILATCVIAGMIFNIVNDFIKINVIREQMIENEKKLQDKVEALRIKEATKQEAKEAKRNRRYKRD